MSDPMFSPVRDEDGDLVGEVQHLPKLDLYRAWVTFDNDERLRLGRHSSAREAEGEIWRYWGMPENKLTPKQREIQERLHSPLLHRHDEPIRLGERDDLAFFANEVGTRLDWHEPDEQDLNAMVYGTSFDNAGFWGEATYEYFTNEMHVVLYVQHYPVVSVNLATLFAWATEDKRGWGLSEKVTESESGEIVDAEIVETRELEA